VAHPCNSSYSAVKDEEDCSLESAQANSLRDPISKLPIKKKKRRWGAGGVAAKVQALSSNLSTAKKIKRNF
jgi:hypothetical protein